jgi:hypothetical protein
MFFPLKRSSRDTLIRAGPEAGQAGPGPQNFGASYFFQTQHTKYWLSSDCETKLHKRRFGVVVCTSLPSFNSQGGGVGSIPPRLCFFPLISFKTYLIKLIYNILNNKFFQ